MAKIVEKEKQLSIDDYMELAGDINLELRQAIHVLNLLGSNCDGLPDKYIYLMATPDVLARALAVTVEKCEEVHSYFLNANRK